MTARAGGPLPIERHAVSLRDPEAAHENIRQSYLDFRVARVSDPEQFEYRTRWAQGGPLRLHQSDYRNKLEAESEPVAHLGVVTSTGGRSIVDNGRQEVYSQAGESYLCIPGLPLSMRSDHPAGMIPLVAYADVVDAAAETTGVDPATFCFLGMAPVNAALGAYWSRVIALAEGQLAGATYYPLVAAEVYRMLVHAVVQVFPNTTTTGYAPAGPGQVTSVVVRRAAEFIEANADRALTLSDIAAAAGVGPRGLQHAFKRQQDVTPMGYLRQVRLSRAHDELRQADPGSGATVAGVAARYGFGHPGRFSQAYAQVYGRLPRETLAAPAAGAGAGDE